MFKKILVANRGEIACRVMRTARSMGIETVAVYSDADARAPHVQMADEAVRIGPAPASESYLSIDAIVSACRETGAEAVHPGYGFLSERGEFARALAEAGIAFVGPGVRAIEIMGDKIASKRFAADAGVSTVPGHAGLVADADEAVRIAQDVGFPVMIKASAGGGGKGMRVAVNADEVRDGFERSRSEAASSFGDDRIFIERFITNPRHIEIQVLADAHGNCIYLGERECSIQRRNQKVLEEAPSPFLDEQTRRAMGEQSVALSKAIDYCGAGTVEFIVDGDRNFYFLEMNTRLQVEHPVTELVTGYDLVEHMLRVAAGETLAIRQDDVAMKGWAIEARVYAEEPERGFLPSIGRINRYDPPEARNDGRVVRVDDGVREGSEISIHYDPMIAKLCTWGEDRLAAIDAMAEALDEFTVEGVGHNLAFLNALMVHPRWRAGELTTAFIDEEFPDGFDPARTTDDVRSEAIAIATSVMARNAARDGTHELEGPVGLIVGDEVVEGQIDRDGGSLVVASSDVLRRVSTDWRPGDAVWRGELDGRSAIARVAIDGGTVTVERLGTRVAVRVLPARIARLLPIMPVSDADTSANELRCPMPGTLVSLAVGPGSQVSAGDALAVVEAMKMENVLRADRDAVVASIDVSPGEGLAVDQRIMSFEAT